MEWLADPQAWIALITLTVLELVLGIDNIVFISILSGNLPQHRQQAARRLGLTLAMLMRIGLLVSIAWLTGLTAPLVTLLGNEISGRDAILIVGGLFLLGKSTHEIHNKLEGQAQTAATGARSTFTSVILQIIALDAVFSIDSVITAIGMVDDVSIMVTAIVVAVALMMVFAGVVSDFVERHPTVKMLALSFLLLIGMALVADGLDQHIPKGYIYFAMGFSVLVEMLNLKLRASTVPPVKLHRRFEPGRGA